MCYRPGTSFVYSNVNDTHRYSQLAIDGSCDKYYEVCLYIESRKWGVWE